MDNFILTELAANDLDQIWDYIADSDIDAADRVIEKLFSAISTLVKQPDMGTVRLELADKRHRFWVSNPYLIVYRPDTKPLQIIRVIHGARDLESLLS